MPEATRESSRILINRDTFTWNELRCQIMAILGFFRLLEPIGLSCVFSTLARRTYDGRTCSDGLVFLETGLVNAHLPPKVYVTGFAQVVGSSDTICDARAVTPSENRICFDSSRLRHLLKLTSQLRARGLLETRGLQHGPPSG
jgi:hypothetical protein